MSRAADHPECSATQTQLQAITEESLQRIESLSRVLTLMGYCHGNLDLLAEMQQRIRVERMFQSLMSDAYWNTVHASVLDDRVESVRRALAGFNPNSND